MRPIRAGWQGPYPASPYDWTFSTLPAVTPQPDKLDRVLEALERIEKKLARTSP